MSRRKQSNPKPLKSDPHEKPPISREFSQEPDNLKKGEEEEWGSDASAMDTDTVSATTADSEAADDIKKTSSPPPQPPPPVAETTAPSEDDKPSDKVATPRIRLKTNLATDPALTIKQEIGNSSASSSISKASEYLAALPQAIQALVSGGFSVPLSDFPVRDSHDVARQVPIYACAPCGIRFSSLSTLEAHQTYYCNHRKNKQADGDGDSKSTNGEPSGNQSDQDLSENPTKVIRTGKQFTCTQCSYSADKKVSLNRHMRMHTVSPSTSSTTPCNGEVSAELQDRYCMECDIHFNSMKTYRAHKTHYCNSRHSKGETNPATTTSASTPTSPVDTTCRSPPSPTTSSTNSTQQHFLALPTNPVLLVPYSLIRGATSVPGIVPNNPDTPYIYLPNGTLQPLSQVLQSSLNQQTKVLKTANKPKETPIKESSSPLDLTVRKTPELNDLVIDEEKENAKRPNSRTPEKIECVPSICGSTSSTPLSGSSPPLKRKHDQIDSSSKSNSPKLITRPNERLAPILDGEANLIAPFIHPLLLRAGQLSLQEMQNQLAVAQIPTVPTPQAVVKQGEAKCKECNIVFYKYENYFTHKKHYCKASLQEDNLSRNSCSPPVSPSSAGPTSPTTTTTQYQQFICNVCQTKFTSLNNLSAHQLYYCSKRGDEEVRRCGKCRSIAEPGHQCLPTGPISGWRCPCCDVVSVTASAAQRHMESHAGIKAYRCNKCGYKGNTLRGMRTHIRLHFDQRPPDLQEEQYISYIVENKTNSGNNVVEINVAQPATSGVSVVTDDRATSPGSEGRVIDNHHMHHCTTCPYTSAHKANVLRHMKLMHPALVVAVTNGSEDKAASSSRSPHSSIDDDEVVIIKKEAIEPEVIIAPVDELCDGAGDVQPQIDKVVGSSYYCESCDIPFNYYRSYIAHKKFYCSSHVGEVTPATNNNNNTSSAAASATAQSRAAAEASAL